MFSHNIHTFLQVYLLFCVHTSFSKHKCILTFHLVVWPIWLSDISGFLAYLVVWLFWLSGLSGCLTYLVFWPILLSDFSGCLAYLVVWPIFLTAFLICQIKYRGCGSTNKTKEHETAGCSIEGKLFSSLLYIIENEKYRQTECMYYWLVVNISI